MKTYLLNIRVGACILPVILLLFSVAAETSGQVPELQNSGNFLLVKLHYTNSSGEEGITDFEYDAFGNILFSRWRLLNGERSSLNRYDVNILGNPILKIRDFSDSLRTSQEFIYNLCGRLIKETWSGSEGITGVVEYFYNENGTLLYADCWNMNGWFTGRIDYLYNSYGILYEAHISRDAEVLGGITYVYDINGNLIIEKWKLDESWEQTFSYKYIQILDNQFVSSNPFIRTSPFFRVSGEYYDYNGELSGPSIYEYDHGKLLGKIFNRSDGLSIRIAYYYDLQGILRKADRVYSDGKKEEFYYEYDSARRMIRKWYNRSDGLNGEEKYVFNKEGQMMLAEYKNKDAWLSGTIAFSHNDLGLPLKGYFKGINGFDAEIYFSYDEYKNLIRIRWNFSSGSYQIYSFNYTCLYRDPLELSVSF